MFIMPSSGTLKNMLIILHRISNPEEKQFFYFRTQRQRRGQRRRYKCLPMQLWLIFLVDLCCPLLFSLWNYLLTQCDKVGRLPALRPSQSRHLDIHKSVHGGNWTYWKFCVLLCKTPFQRNSLCPTFDRDSMTKSVCNVPKLQWINQWASPFSTSEG